MAEVPNQRGSARCAALPATGADAEGASKKKCRNDLGAARLGGDQARRATPHARNVRVDERGCRTALVQRADRTATLTDDSERGFASIEARPPRDELNQAVYGGASL